MREKASEILRRLAEIEEKMASGDFSQLDEYKRLKEIEPLAREYLKTVDQLEQARELLDDPELGEMAEEEAEELARKEEELRRKLTVALLPKRPEDDGNALLEIRAGTGGEEAALFAADLVRMYARFAERKGFRVSLVDSHSTPLGGYKEAVLLVEGKGAYRLLKHESGVHRVQRVPITESGGRIHTSTASVVVLPEVPEVEVEIKPEEIEIETMRSGGPGGQHANMTDSAVRITHKPTGIVVVCQDERSQHKNREKALRILRARLYELKLREQEEQLGRMRRTYIGTGDRSEKIRTYNFPQNRVTDHRINLTLYKLEEILDGDLDELVDALLEAEAQRMAEELEKSQGLTG